MGKNSLKNIINEQEYNDIVQMYQNNISLREIERITHHGRNAISKMLEEDGIKTTKGNHYRKYFFNENFFEKVDNELTAYWLGFLYADGCIISTNPYGQSSFKITLGEKDEEILIKYKEDLQSTYPLRYDRSQNRKNPNQQVQVICEYKSQKAVNDLKKLGCIERKSLVLTFPKEEIVPKEYLRHFVRGYFDGDGSISSHNGAYIVNVVGTESFIKELYNFFNMGSIFPDKRKENSWYLSIGGNYQVIKVYHLLYDNSTRYMERKYLKFKELITKYDESQGA